MAVERLAQSGFPRIAYVNLWQIQGRTFASQHYSMRDRLAGYRQAMARRGLTRLEMAGTEDRTVAERCHEVLRSSPNPVGIVLYHAGMALPFLTATATLGLQVPRDLALATFSVRPDVFGGL